MHSVPTGTQSSRRPADLETVRREFSTGDLGWRDLPSDGRVMLAIRFTTTELIDVHGSYQGRTVTFTVRDSTRGIVTLTDQSAQVVDVKAVRALRAALDEIGVRLARE
jgi:acetolactate synthase regulatory subunit